MAISAVGLEKSFGATPAVAGIDLAVSRGETVAILGPNGAGKTTTISIMLGLLLPDSGSVRLLGRDPLDASAAGLVGAVLQDGGLMSGVRVGELLRMLAGLYPTPLSVSEVVSVARLDGLEKQRVDRLSGGQTQRLRVAAAMVGNPELLVLDEPTAAMDVDARRSFWATMRDAASRGQTIVFSTHYLEEADDFADRVIVMANGRVVADGTPSSIKASIGRSEVRFTMSGAEVARLEELPGVESVVVHRHLISLGTGDRDATLRAVITTWPQASDFELSDPRLEDAFVALTETSETGA